ncbi:ATP-binding protein [Lentzea sp. NPDC003310]|uniref:ATP-binding protein n=1 Tax=Lentzea sp. NPDC003310 TaxID=3154447 RepID=UPI00339DD029
MAEEPGVAIQATNRFSGDLPVPRSAYLHQVEQIAPASLIGREHELAELAEFCTSASTSGRYLWWRAEAWSGKTALLSSFALDPPAGVTVVSFFITSRLSGQNDQTAFLDNVLEQLFLLLGEEVPELLTEATKHAHLLRLLDSATTACHSRGESFVLVVDGLDEDNGAGVHSIASLLPVRPPDGMRIVVAGRPNPPPDAPDDHPLRSGTAEVRSLTPSPAAVALRRETERELKTLMHAVGLQKDVLGLIAAAGGGLTSSDLVELTGASSYEVEDLLCTVAGRSFAGRGRTYLLAHEELQVTAVRMFGSVLGNFRDRLHVWAEKYGAQEWPEATPEYLLQGYPSMLRSAPDPARLVELVTDRLRQSRLRWQTGGDAAAYSQILAAQQLVAEHTPNDLLSMARLASSRGELGAGNRRLPIGLPAVWEKLGHPDRATALAHGIVNRNTRSQALAILSKAVAESGDLSRAESIADTIDEARWQAQAFTDLTLILASSGGGQHAEHMLTKARGSATKISDAYTRTRALVHLARALHLLGHREQASALLDTAELFEASELDLLTIELVSCAESFGEIERVYRVAYTASDPHERVALLAAAGAESLAQGQVDRASTLFVEAEALVSRQEQDIEMVSALTEICRGAAPLGDRAAALAEQAYAAAKVHNNPRPHDSTLLELVDCSIACGDLEGAENTARMIEDITELPGALAKVAQLALAHGDKTRADALIAEIAALDTFGDSVNDLALFLIQCGQKERAAILAELAETTSRGRSSSYMDYVASHLVSAFSSLGWYDEAEAATPMIESATERARALLDILTALKPTANRQRWHQLFDSIDSIWPEVVAGFFSDEIAMDLVRVTAAAGEFKKLSVIVDSMPDQSRRIMALTAAALALALLDREAATAFAERAEASTRSSVLAQHPELFSRVALAFDAIGDADRANKIITEQLPNVFRRDLTWREIARNAAMAGDHVRARGLARSIRDPYQYEMALAEVAVAKARAGLTDEAEELALVLKLDHHRDLVNYAITIAIARTGNFARARQYLDMVPHRDHAPLLDELAVVAASMGESAVAKQFLMQSLTTSEQWYRSLTAIGKVDPDVLRQISAVLQTPQS